MYQEKIFRQPVELDRFRGRDTVRNMLKTCDCGCMTFLDLPCQVCGKTPRRSAYGQWKKRYHQFLLVGVIFSVCAPLVAAILAGLFLHLVFCILLTLGTIAVLVVDVIAIQRLVQEDTALETFWLLHQSGDLAFGKGSFRRGKPRKPVEGEMMEPILDAYYRDLNRLERMADAGQWQMLIECADRLSYVYTNPRLSRIQLRSVLNQPVNEDTALDLNLICSHLGKEDVEPEQVWPLLHQLGDYLLRAECLQNDQIKRLFREMVEQLLRQRRYTQSPILGDGSLELQLYRIFGQEPFDQAWGGVRFDQNGSVILSADDEDGTYGALAKALVTCERKHHGQLMALSLWPQLIFTLSQFDQPSMVRLYQYMKRRYLYDRRTGSTSRLYDAIYGETVRELKVIETLLPEERWYINQVLCCCVYDENGQLYSRSTPIFRQLVDAGDSFLRSAQEEQWAKDRQLPPTEDDLETDRIFGAAPAPQPVAVPQPKPAPIPTPTPAPAPAPQPVQPPAAPTRTSAEQLAKRKTAGTAGTQGGPTTAQRPNHKGNNSADDLDKFAELMESLMYGKGNTGKGGK